ncbi:MAG TPA: sulfate adenylyltransferase subunit CysN [Candidatus Dormibacteraeota bacterium]|nr:sulfate adenylyltransferase subunit CysN [Candidatus Dormibacteraeota bacterium]
MISSGHGGRDTGFAAFLQQDLNTELLRFTTAGSVDDGKSTLIGRLLHDSKSVYEDQLASVKKSRVNRSSGPIDFSLLTDGLRAEREQGITIDVAYRYFATARRKFIIADTPGHEQYTRNMATGASTADLAVILIDGAKGLLPQTRRHAFIASLLGIPNVLAAVNKMDMVEYRQDIFLTLQKEFLQLAAHLGIAHVQCIPISALEGDNVVQRSAHMPWYRGPALLEYLETVPLPEKTVRDDFRFPVQSVIRPDAAFRGFAGRVAGGVVRPGDEVLALPSGQKTRVGAIVTYGGELPQAIANMSVTLRLEDEIDLSRGEMLVSPAQPPHVSRAFGANVVWLHSDPMEVGKTYLVKHAVRQTKIKATRIVNRVDVNTFAKESATRLQMNDIAEAEFETSVPLFFDPYAKNRTTGSFILIDALTNATVGAGMITHASIAEDHAGRDRNAPVRAEERRAKNGHDAAVIVTSSRSDLTDRIDRELFERGFQTVIARQGEIAPSELLRFARLAKSGGLILIYSGDAPDEPARKQIAEIIGNQLFVVSEEKAPSDDEEIIRKVLEFVEALRVAAAPYQI